MGCWDNPEDRKKCVKDAIGIAILSSIVAGSLGFVLGLYVSTIY